ncbi:MAG: ECF-type sigma factor [Gemmatimonadota bacterium]
MFRELPTTAQSISSPADSPLTSSEVTSLLEALRHGDQVAGDRLLPMLYQVLHDIASRLMRGERPDHTLQPTILLHDAWLKLTADRASPWTDRGHFLALASRAMRRLLVDHARARNAAKRRGDLAVPLDDQLAVGSGPDLVDVIALDDALDGLARVHDRAHRVVELRYFGGLEWHEIAVVLGAAERTVKRDWDFARAWLRQRMEGSETAPVPFA